MREHSAIQAAVLVIAVAVRFIPGPASGLAYVILAAYALLGPAHAIEALGVSWFITGINPGLAGPLASGAGRFITLAAAAASVFGRDFRLVPSMRVRRPVLFTALFGAFLVLHSPFFSKMPDVSILKAITWVLAACVSISAWSRLTQDDADQLIGRIRAGLAAIVILSIPLVVSPLGFYSNGFGFQGLLNQPQLLGVVAGLLGSWTAMRMLSVPRPRLGDAALVAICVVVVLLSESRTGGLGLVLGFSAALLLAPVLAGRPLRGTLPGLRSPRIHAVIALLLLVVLFVGPLISNQVEVYLTKRGYASDIAGAYSQSRGVLLDPMLANIRAHPVVGIGFGVASLPARRVADRGNFLGLPMSAAVEKGTAPVAVFEELGIFGLGAAGWWLWMISRRIARNGVEELAVLCTILAVNLGESFIFSAGGTGLLALILIGWGARPHRGAPLSLARGSC